MMRPPQSDDRVLRRAPAVDEYDELISDECATQAVYLCSAAARTGRWVELIAHLTALQARSVAAAAEERSTADHETLVAAQRILDARGSNLKII